MRSIRDDLSYQMQSAEFTGKLPDTRLVKAFRAKEFNRCPKCDNVGVSSYRSLNHTQTIKCQSCNTKILLEDYEIFKYWQESKYYMSDAYVLLIVDKMLNER